MSIAYCNLSRQKVQNKSQVADSLASTHAGSCGAYIQLINLLHNTDALEPGEAAIWKEQGEGRGSG